MIADSETNQMYFSDHLKESHSKTWTELCEILRRNGIPTGLLKDTKEQWARDYMPVQLDNRRYVQFTYTPFYLRGREDLLTPAEDCRLDFMQDYRQVPLVLEGGNVVALGNHVFVTETVYRDNPDKTRLQVRQLLEATFEADCIFIPKESLDDIGHADGVVRFVTSDMVVINDYSKVNPDYGQKIQNVLKRHHLKYEVLPYSIEDLTFDGIQSAVGCHINYLQANALLIVPTFGIESDDSALRKLEALFPGTTVVSLRCKELARQGGVLRCVSWGVRIPTPQP